jgi:ADP-ribose pyrophosphatase YjhB (NUDIX family)/ribosomal protein S18 acetylase RimI-like enzyme
MQVMQAEYDDIPAWLDLTAEVEVFFGPLVDEAGFRLNLRKNVERGTALCVREDDGPPGTPLMGGLMFGPKPPKYELAFLAVAERWRRQGVASALVKQFFTRVIRPANVVLLTFADTEPTGQAATAFYRHLGFIPGEYGPVSLTGVRTQVYRITLERPPTVRGVIRHNGRVLLVQHHYLKPENHGKWSLPGGWLDEEDRDHAAALRRELREELGVATDVVRTLGTYPRKGQDHHVYLVQPHSLDFRFDDQEIAGVGWFTPDEVCALDADGKLLAEFIRAAVEAAWADS